MDGQDEQDWKPRTTKDTKSTNLNAARMAITAITTSSSMSVNALGNERPVFTPRNWYVERLPAWPSARNIKKEAGHLARPLVCVLFLVN